MIDVQVDASAFHRLSKALKQAGETELRKELHAGLRRAAKPLIPGAQQALSRALPSGLKQRGNRTRLAVQVKTGRDPGVTIGKRFNSRGSGIGHSNARLINDRGQFRHPVYGNEKVWVAQSRPGGRGWFDDTMRRNAPSVRPEIERSIQNVIDEVVRRAR